MKKSMLKVLMVLALGAIILMPGMSGAAYTTYTNEATFTGLLAPGYYLENFQSLPYYDLLNQTESFGPVNGFSYDAYAVNWLYSAVQSSTVDNRDLSTFDPTDPIVFTFTGAPVYAFGGQFFPSDVNGYDATGTAYFTIGNDTISLAYNTLYDRPFLGIISDTPLTSVSIASGSGQWPTADHVYAGKAGDSPVPVPPSALLLGSGLLGLVGWRRFRKS